MEWTDREAARQASAGDQAAFRVLVDRHSHAIFRLAFRMCGNEHDAEDAVQETFLRAYKQLKQFDGRSAFGTWLYRICVNCCLDLIRARKQRRESSYDWLEQVTASTPSPEQLLQSREISALLLAALENLSDNERTAFILRHFEGWGIPEIAETLKLQDGAAKHSVFRAVQKLRRALQPVWEPQPR